MGKPEGLGLSQSAMSMTDVLRQIREAVGRLKLDDSLLFLNHLLGLARRYTTDPVLGPVVSKASPPVFPHIVHFLAKQLLLHASNLGARPMTWDQFQRFSSLCIELDDPIQHDPNWKHADPTPFFVRVFAQQLSPQRRNMLQKYGLALGLFRDVGVVEWPRRYDLRADLEAELGIPIEQFMAMGHVTFALRTAEHQGNKCIGTFTPRTLAEAYRQGIDFCVAEVWTPFLDRVSCDRDRFREVADQDPYKVQESLFEQFGFNPLRRFPIINLGESRYLAVDPELIVERVTFGLFYDLFERDQTSFSERFGYAFDQFVGQLLASVCPCDRLWSAAEWEKREGRRKSQSSKKGDRAYIGNDLTVLFECKSLRPSLKLTTYGSDKSIEDTVARVASALEQLIIQSADISEGKWEQAGLSPRQTVGAVVVYGQMYTVNSPFFRKRVRQILTGKGLDLIPFVVLSLEELDMTMRLVENGHPLDRLMESLAADERSFDPVHKFHNELEDCAVSSFTLRKGHQFLEKIVRKRAGGSENRMRES